MSPTNPLDWALRLDTPPRIDVPELIDDEAQPYADFRESMGDVRRANRFLGGTVVVTRQMRRWLTEIQKEIQTDTRSGSGAPIRILDVATGSGDIPEAILAVARPLKVPVEIVGLDYSAPILRYARERVGDREEIRLVRGDAFNLPFADRSFDYVLCSLAFHHWGFERSVDALREMERVARRGWLVNDLRRAWSAWYLIRMVAALVGVNRLTRHDAPASVLRAYSLAEYADMPRAIHLEPGRDVQVAPSRFYRVAMVREMGRERR